MKILALTPINQNNLRTDSVKQNLFINKGNNYDTVSFQAGKKKAAEMITPKMFDGILDNIGGELGEKVKELLNGKESRPVFMTMLISLAATATDLILKNKTNTQAENKTVENSEKSDKKEPVQPHKKSGRKSIVDKMGEKEFIAKLQEMVDNDFTIEQMSESLGGLSEKSIKNYIKQYKIEKQAAISSTGNGKKPGRKSKEEKLAEFINSNEARQEYLKKIEPYPELLAHYKKAIENMVFESNEYNKNVLEGMEKTFNNLFALKPKHNKPFFEKFNNTYGSNFDKVCLILNNTAPDKTLQECLAEFKNNNYSAELIEKWVEYPAFTPEELELTAELPNSNKQAIYNLKKKKAFSFNLIRNEKYHNYGYILNFSDKTDLPEKLKTISEFHEALYDNICLHKERSTIYPRAFDIQEELLNLVKKDKNLDSIYNILKYIAPEEMESVNYTPEQYMPVNELEIVNADSRRKMEEIIRNLDIKNNKQLDELEDVLSDSDIIFGDLIENNHAKLRFISRFVINKKIEKDSLYENCNLAVERLEKEIDKKLKNGCMVFPYTMNDSTAPSFYLDKSPLGDYVKITLNNCGQIHTIFEDAKRKSSLKS